MTGEKAMVLVRRWRENFKMLYLYMKISEQDISIQQIFNKYLLFISCCVLLATNPHKLYILLEGTKH